MAIPQNFTTVQPILRNAQLDLTGTTAVKMLTAPPQGETYLLRRLNGVNTAGANRSLVCSLFDGVSAYRRFHATAVTTFPFTARLANQPGPHDFFAVMNADGFDFFMASSGTGTDPIQLDYEVVPSGAHKNAKATLSGTTWVEILAAPPRGTTYAIRTPDGANTSGGTRFLHIAVLKATKHYYLHTMRGLNSGSWGLQSEANMPRAPGFIGCLDDPDESLVVSLSGTGTNTVSVDYDIIVQ